MIPRLTFDLETIPDQRSRAKERIATTITPPGNISKAETIAAWEVEKRPALIEAAWRKTSLNGGVGRIATIGWKLNSYTTVSKYSDDWSSDEGETETINAFFDAVNRWLRALRDTGNSMRPQVIGHNVINFDLRFLFQRCVILQIKPPLWLPLNVRPWDTDVVFDTMVAWAGHRDYVRMDTVCEALGIAGKGSEFDGDEDIDGSKVWDYVRDGKIATVARYCEGDVDRTWAMYQRMNFER